MNKKIEYMAAGATLSMINVVLIDTPYTVIGMFFGLISVVYWLKAVGVRK